MQHPPLKCLTQEVLDTVAQQARQSPRLRQNYNFHNLTDKVQRFVNVLQPGTYIRPHRHLRSSDSNGFEFFLVLQGELGILILNEVGQVIHTTWVSDRGTTRGVELEEGTYHTLIALAPNTAILELKEGPYDPTSDKEFLSMFPAEGTPEARELVTQWENYFTAVNVESFA